MKKKSQRIEVTAAMIAAATQADSSHCMIADAIQANLPDVRRVSVDLQSIRFTEKSTGNRYIFLTPAVCQQRLLQFDAGQAIEPWAFVLPARASQITRYRRKKPEATTEGGTEATTEIPVKRRFLPGALAQGHPEVRGGRTPPIAVLAGGPGVSHEIHKGRIRRFGLRMAGGFDREAANG